MSNYEAALKTQLISLNSRLEVAKGFVMNADMVVECRLLRAQIEAIKEELKTI